jgi:F-type H+-transporting ATPase subunit delta
MPADRTIALRYARALANLTEELALTEQADAHLEALRRRLDQEPRVLSLMSNPGLTILERRTLLDSLLEGIAACAPVRNLLSLLLDKHRFACLPSLLDAWRDLMDEKAGRLRATVTTSLPGGEELARNIQEALMASTGRPVSVVSRHDPDLIAGVVVQVKDTVFDASLKTRLESMRRLLSSSPA